MQDTRIDATPGYLRSMASTQQVLAALHRAHTANHTITANRPPATAQTLEPPDPQARAPTKHFEWISCGCKEVACSQCGSWVADVQQASLYGCAAEPENDNLQVMFVYDIVVYSTTDSLQQQQASFRTGSSQPILQWCQSHPLLGIAHMPRVRRSGSLPGAELQAALGVPSEHPAAFIWDAEAQAVQHSLGPETSAVVRGLGCHELQGMAWSPVDRRYLLVYGHRTVGPETGASPGCLSLVDLHQGSLVASSGITGMRDPMMSYCDAIAWHPSQQAFIMDCDIGLEDKACFQQAGFAVAALPDSLHISAGFSEDAGHLVAVWLDEEMQK